MGDLIDRDKIYEAVYDLACKSVGVIGGISEDYACGLREAAHMIEEAPAVDAVPVVRCKNCVYGEPCKWPAKSDGMVADGTTGGGTHMTPKRLSAQILIDCDGTTTLPP